MRIIWLIFLMFFFNFNISASIIHLTHKERYKEAELVVSAKVISIVQVIDKSKLNDDFGATQMAVLKIQKIWKNPKWSIIPLNENQKFEPVDIKVPEYIMIPCGYNYDEAFSLSMRQEYVLFLKQVDSTLYIPIDPYSAYSLKGTNVYLATPLESVDKNKLILPIIDFIKQVKG